MAQVAIYILATDGKHDFLDRAALAFASSAVSSPASASASSTISGSPPAAIMVRASAS
jgi:hypothetical protein